MGKIKVIFDNIDKTVEEDNTVNSISIDNAPLTKEWIEIFNETNNDKRNELVVKLWEDLEMYEVAQMLSLGLEKVELVFVDDTYKVEYSESLGATFYGHFNPNIEGDMISKFGGIDPMLLKFSQKLHDGFYSDNHKEYDGWLPPILEMKTIQESGFLEAKYLENGKIDINEFKDCSIDIENEEEFASKTILVAKSNYLRNVCRNTNYLDNYFIWDMQGDLELKDFEDFMDALEEAIMKGIVS